MGRQTTNSVPVNFAAKAYGKDPSWVRAGLITGYLPIGTATRNGKQVTSIDEMDSKYGRINYYISPKRLYEETGVVWNQEAVEGFRVRELLYFCRQYPEWKRHYAELESGISKQFDPFIFAKSQRGKTDPTASKAIAMSYYKDRMDMVERCCDRFAEHSKAIFEYVTEGPRIEEVAKKYGIEIRMFQVILSRFFNVLGGERG